MDPISIHAFMLPLRWDCITRTIPGGASYSDIPFDDRTSLETFHKHLVETKWKRQFYRIGGLTEEEAVRNYNELTYFHHYCWPVLYDLQEFSEKDESQVSKRNVVLYYEYEIPRGGTNIYEIHIKGQEEPYRLRLDGISMHVFNTGVLILTYNCSNFEYAAKEDILRINEVGRRIYPQFLSVEKDRSIVDRVKDTFLAERIKLIIGGETLAEETFCHYQCADNLRLPEWAGEEYRPGRVIVAPNFLTKLFPDTLGYGDNVVEKGHIRIKRITDDRMFFQCWYGDNVLARLLGQQSRHKRPEELVFDYETSAWWYSFVFGDKGGPSIANLRKMRQDLKACTYDRWVNYGTLFGLTRDSFVAVSSELKSLRNNNAPDLSVHMRSMYYQIAVLSLAQRATVLKFSAEVSMLADLAKKDETDAVDRIKSLYLNYIEFINKMYFREVTSQIQGIELYNKFQEQMDLPRDVKDLDSEIEELHRFANLLVQEKEAKQAKRLTILASIFLPSTLIASILGMNALDLQSNLYFGEKWNWTLGGNWVFITVLPLILIIAFMSLNWFLKNRIHKWLVSWFFEPMIKFRNKIIRDVKD